ncbi:hypothetical protein MASR1M74_28990 [Lentimicrobium sp.]
MGGIRSLKEFIVRELMYPDSCIENKTEGTVVIRFTTDNTGNVLTYRLAQSISPACDAESVRIFKMIEWLPAYTLGVPHADSGILEIEFNLKKYRRMVKTRGYSKHYYPYEPMDTSGVVYKFNELHTPPRPIFSNENISLPGFIAANLNYPEAAIKQNIHGVVIIGFIVEPHGRISNVRVIESLGAGCNEETIRLVNLLKWMPGTYDHLAVRTRMTLSITFSLDPESGGMFNSKIKSSYGG